jgi:penicillin-insensitive murein endopeptidase
MPFLKVFFSPPRYRAQLGALFRRSVRVARCRAVVIALAGSSFGMLACGPGFFAQEPRQAHDVAPALGASGVSIVKVSNEAGLSCTPLGCPPEAAAVRSLPEGSLRQRVPQAGSVARTRARVAPTNHNHPLRGTAHEEIDRLVRTDLASLGSMSFGTAIRGGLLNAVHLPDDPRWTVMEPNQAWATAETVDYLVSAMDAVFAEFPDSHPIFIGDISGKRGGYLKPHLSHQSGKDVDVGYFYTHNPEWYLRVTPSNLDRQRTWAFLRALITRTDVHFIFIDYRVQRLLRSYAESIGEDPAWLTSVFQGHSGEEPMIRHEPGHDTHFHVRFYNPIAEETARRCYAALIQQKKLLPQRYNTTHRVKPGETLIGLAKRYGTTVGMIMRANALRQKMIQANKTYFIPQNGPAAPAPPRPVPPRRVPPALVPAGPVASLSP